MKKYLILLWLIAPVAFLYFHFQWGPKFLFEQEIAKRLSHAQSLEQEQNWKGAIKQYNDILTLIRQSILDDQKQQLQTNSNNNQAPTKQDNSLTNKELLETHIELMRAKAMTNTQQLTNATNLLEQLIANLDQHQHTGTLTDEVRCNLAICQYYITWHMRTEGMLRSDWLPEIESSRQIFKFLANKYAAANLQQQAQDMQKNLEAAIRLKHMALPSLKAMQLPDKGAGKGERQAGQKRKADRSNKKNKQQDKGDAKGKSKSNRPGQPNDSRKGEFQKFKLPEGS